MTPTQEQLDKLSTYSRPTNGLAYVCLLETMLQGLLESRPVDGGADKLAKAARQADKAWRDAEEKIAANLGRPASMFGTPPHLIPEGAVEFESEGMRALRFMDRKDLVEVRVHSSSEWDARWPAENTNRSEWGYLFKYSPDSLSSVEFSRRAAPWLRHQMALYPYTEESDGPEHAKDAMQKHLSAAVDAIDEVFDTPQETEPGDALEEGEPGDVWRAMEKHRDGIDSDTWNDLADALQSERARNAKRVAELEERIGKIQTLCRKVSMPGETDLESNFLLSRPVETGDRADVVAPNVTYLADTILEIAAGRVPEQDTSPPQSDSARIAELEAELELAGQSVTESYEDELTALRERIAELEKAYDAQRAELEETSAEVDRLESQLKEAGKREEELESELRAGMPKGKPGRHWAVKNPGSADHYKRVAIAAVSALDRGGEDVSPADVEEHIRNLLDVIKSLWSILDFTPTNNGELVQGFRELSTERDTLRRELNEAKAEIYNADKLGPVLDEFPLPTEAPALVWREAPNPIEEPGRYWVRNDQSQPPTLWVFSKGQFCTWNQVAGPLHITEPTEPKGAES